MNPVVAGHFGKEVVGEGAGEYLLAEIVNDQENVAVCGVCLLK